MIVVRSQSSLSLVHSHRSPCPTRMTILDVQTTLSGGLKSNQGTWAGVLQKLWGFEVLR